MYGFSASDAISGDISRMMFPSTFQHASDGDFSQMKEFIYLDPYSNHCHDHQQQQNQQQQISLKRFRSAPSSFFANLISGTHSETDNNSCDVNLLQSEGFLENSREILSFPLPTKQEDDSISESNHMVYNNNNTSNSSGVRNLENHDFITANSDLHVGNSFGVMNSAGSNLVRQSSSPAGFLSSLTVENGIPALRDARKDESCSRLSNHDNFSSGPSFCSRFMPQSSVNVNACTRLSSPENKQLGRSSLMHRTYNPSNQKDLWHDSTFSGLKMNQSGDLKIFPGLNGFKNQNGDCESYATGLIHHLSLPNTSSEKAAIEKFLHFQQESIPIKIRAKRGFATHPRSIAERVRRTRISERMRKLQELFPSLDKQSNTADMLDMAIDYIKDLQREVQTLTDTRARCRCPTQQ